jgi:hypothetical protein
MQRVHDVHDVHAQSPARSCLACFDRNMVSVSCVASERVRVRVCMYMRVYLRPHACVSNGVLPAHMTCECESVCVRVCVCVCARAWRIGLKRIHA